MHVKVFLVLMSEKESNLTEIIIIQVAPRRMISRRKSVEFSGKHCLQQLVTDLHTGASDKNSGSLPFKNCTDHRISTKERKKERWE